MAQKIYSSASEDNFHVIPEFERHKGCWMVWPERTDNWRLGAKPAQNKFVEIANLLIKHEEVTVLVSKWQFENARKKLNSKIRIIEMSTNDCFIRDYGPIFLKNFEAKEVRGLKFNFNAWGGEKEGIYFPWNYDQMVAFKMFEIEKTDYYELPFILEPSMLAFDGKGTCFASLEGIINENRNPNLTQEQVEYYLKEYLNIIKVIWIPFGLPNDEIKGRLENIMCFVDSKTILLSWTANELNDSYEAVQKAWNVLSKATNAYEKKYTVIKVELPEIASRNKTEIEMIDYNSDHNPLLLNQNIAGSYVNLYIANDMVLIPTFNDPLSEEKMLKVMKVVFAEYHIILIDIRELLLGKSGVHSLICHQPK